MIVGVGQFGRCLLEAAARESRRRLDDHHGHRPRRPGAVQAILLAQPGLAKQARIDPIDIDLERPGRDAADRLHAVLGGA